MKNSLRIVLPLILFAILGGFLMMINGVLVFSLRREFYITASMTGVMTGSFFFFTAFAQVALTHLQKSHEPKWILMLLTFIAAFGMVIFATASSVFGLTLGRAVIGVGFCGSMFVAFFVFMKIFAHKYKPLFFSSLLIASSIGGVLATYPTYMGVQAFGWQKFMLLLALITIALGFLIAFVSPRFGFSQKNISSEKEILSLTQVMKSLHFQKVALPLVTGIGTFLAFQSLWITPWLVQGNHMTLEHAVFSLCLSAVGMFVGVVQGTLWSDQWMVYARHALFIVAIILMAVTPISQYAIFWFFFGYCIQIAHFGFKAIGSGEGMIALHSLILGMTFVMQVVIGCVIDIWDRNLHEHYPAIAFKAAFMVTAFINAIAWLISICMNPAMDEKRG